MVNVIFLAGIIIFWMRGCVSFGGWDWCLKGRVGGDWICPNASGGKGCLMSECKFLGIDVELFSRLKCCCTGTREI